MRRLVLLVVLAFSLFNSQFSLSALRAQTAHDITKVDPAPPSAAIAVPLPEAQRRRLKKYEIPELAGSKQALGSQLIGGELPAPLLDYAVHEGPIDQRISFFAGDLVVVSMTGAGGSIRKKLILPHDATTAYLKAASAAALRAVRTQDLTAPRASRSARLRIYQPDGTHVERVFDPVLSLPNGLATQIAPLADLLRAISEDRTVTNSVAGYEPKVGDELVGDDQKTYRVVRVVEDGGIVELRCLGQPTSVWVAKKDLYNYFVGARAQ